MFQVGSTGNQISLSDASSSRTIPRKTIQRRRPGKNIRKPKPLDEGILVDVPIMKEGGTVGGEGKRKSDQDIEVSN